MEARMGASLVKIHFHDCFVNGCDGSVLLDDTSTFTGEKTAVPNKNSLRGFDVIDTIKTNVEAICKQTVFCADIVAVSARDAVVALGGASWEVQLGRRDSKTASIATANSDIPSPSSSISALISAVSKKGLSATDMVALYGAHTIGHARCTVFRTRLIIDISPRTVKPLFRPAMSSFAPHQCANRGRSHENMCIHRMLPVPTTRTWGATVQGGSADSQVNSYTSNSAKFFSDFSAAMVKMGNISPLTGIAGEIRTNCRKTN